MNLTQKKTFIFAPFCIYHNNDKRTNTFHSFIGYPAKYITSSGYETISCESSSQKFGSWTYAGSFYAISAMLRPIPPGLKLIQTEKLMMAPYDTKKIIYAYDPFDIKKESVSFLTWTQPVSGTVPLYLHITPGGHSYPSFQPNPPEENTGWTLNKLSPLYVLVDKNNYHSTEDINNQELYEFPKDKNGIPKFKFIVSDNRCIPNPNGMSLTECFLKTNIFTPNENITQTLLERIENINKKGHNNTHNFFKKFRPFFIILTLIIFLGSLITSIIILSRKEIN
jgi:hypothetical protein